MPGRIRISADIGRHVPRHLTRKARVAGVEMLLITALGIALGLAGQLPLNLFTGAVFAILALLGCLFVGRPEMLIRRMAARGVQARIRQAQIDATRAHFEDDLTMPASDGWSAHDRNQAE